MAHRQTLRKMKAGGGIVHFHVQPLSLPIIPLVLPGKGKEASATLLEEDPADGAVLRGGTSFGRDGRRSHLAEEVAEEHH